MKIVFLILILAVVFCGCKKDATNIVGHWQCSQSQQMDSSVIINKLAASWVWKKYACGDDPTVRTADKTVKITFSINGSFTIIENMLTVSQGTWKIKRETGNTYGLELSQPSGYLYGGILFCENELLFNDSYRDGCDNLFLKSN